MLDALAACELGPAAAKPAVGAMLAAFERFSHEKPFTLWALDQIVERLERLGLVADATRVRALIAKLDARFGVLGSF